MSQKNFASYGDMETLVTEIASKCGPYTEISYEDWLNLTPYQQEHGRWDVTGVPGADGTVSIDLMTKLWENPNPTASFAAQDITNLPLSDYDIILYTTGDAGGINTVNKRHIIEISGYSASVNYVFRRVFTPNVSTGVINVSGCIGYKIQDGTESTFNTLNIPLAIYGIKLHHTVEIKAIAPTVSTLAKNSVFNPTGTSLESTNAEDAIKELESNFQDGVDAVYDAVVAKGSTPASHSLSDVVTGIGNIPTGITPSGIYTYPSGSTGGTVDVTNYAQVNAANVYEAGKKNPNFNISKITATQPATSYKTCILPTTGYYAVFTIVIDSTTPRIVRLVDCEEWKFLNNTAINIINSYNSKYLLVMYTVKANAANATLGAYIGAMGSSSFDVFVIKIKDL